MISNAALVIIDVQNDFCPGGALAVPGGNRVIKPLNRIVRRCAAQGLPVLASRDWHPQVTRHFKEFGGIWPPHCVQGSTGAAFHPRLHLPKGTLVISKGTDPDADSYSAFDGTTESGISFREALARLQVNHLYIGGLATDYCVRYSVLDARRNGFEVTVLTDAIAGVEAAPGDCEKALQEMMGAGATFRTTEELDFGVEPIRAPGVSNH